MASVVRRPCFSERAHRPGQAGVEHAHACAQAEARFFEEGNLPQVFSINSSSDSAMSFDSGVVRSTSS